MKSGAKLYPLATAEKPPDTVFVKTSEKRFNTISANTVEFYDELNSVVQNEPANFVSLETVGLFASIGVRKGEPFGP